MVILEKFSLKNKVAVVTGARTGIGRGIAIALADAGAHIAGVGNNDMPETAREVNELGRRFYFHKADLMKTDKKDAAKIIQQIEIEFGHIDILVNNAGIIRRENVLDFGEKDWFDVLNVNQNALFFLSQAFARRCSENGQKGKIINIASMLTFQGGIRVASYTASKSAVAGITRIMANELALHNIQVNAIAPGYIATNNTEALQKDEVRNAEILARIPAGRWGVPEDMAGAAVFLASEASDYLTGQIIAVDGGWLSR
jgi:2-deoxy-D-gluconate 3-dehydrogenase